VTVRNPSAASIFYLDARQLLILILLSAFYWSRLDSTTATLASLYPPVLSQRRGNNDIESDVLNSVWRSASPLLASSNTPLRTQGERRPCVAEQNESRHPLSGPPQALKYRNSMLVNMVHPVVAAPALTEVTNLLTLVLRSLSLGAPASNNLPIVPEAKQPRRLLVAHECLDWSCFRSCRFRALQYT
jgi:hypothetical protein